MLGKRSGLVAAAVASVAASSLLVAGCGGDDKVKVSDFEGSWDGTAFTITARDDPSASVDVVQLGATFKIDIDEKRKCQGEMGAPAALGGPATIPFTGALELDDQETITFTLDEEVPRLLTRFTGPFTLEDDTATLGDPGMTFDFGKGAVPAVAKMTMVRK